MKFEKIMIDHENYMPMDENQLQSDKINRSTTAMTDWSNIWFISLEKQFILMVLTWQGIQLKVSLADSNQLYDIQWIHPPMILICSDSPVLLKKDFILRFTAKKQKLKYSVVVLSNIFSGSVWEIWSLVLSKIKIK